MLSVILRYANQHHYNIHPTKTKIVQCTNSKTSTYEDYWNLGETLLQTSDEAVHLGLKCTSKNEGEINILDRLKVARRTKYALMGSGVHGTNELDPKTTYQIYNTYALPRLLFGLEVLPLKTTHINKLEDFHRKTIRFLQSLPHRTSIAAIYLLMGALPLRAEYHKKQLSLLYSLLACENNNIHEIMIRQISVNYDNENSFFTNIRDVLYMYELPTISEFQHQLPTNLV
jgi:hypothetical protein